MSYLINSLGFGQTTKKVPFTVEQLVNTKDNLKKIDQDTINSWSDPLDSSSWNYLKKWIKDNPREFDEAKLAKFRNVILDPDFPSIRQRFPIKPEHQEYDTWGDAKQAVTFVSVYFVALNLLASIFS